MIFKTIMQNSRIYINIQFFLCVLSNKKKKNHLIQQITENHTQAPPEYW